jgi:copper(I)-binding protein
MKILISTIFMSFSFCSFAKTNFEIKNAYVRFPPPGSTTTALYLDFVNNDEVDHKVSNVSGTISDDFELHEMNMDNGKMTMRKLESILVKKKTTMSLKSGGFHVMIFNLKRPLKINEKVEINFLLENKAKIQIKAIVQKMD